MRLYKISIRLSSGAIWREWETTCCISAMQFVHSFGPVGFGLYSTPYNGPAIQEVTQTKQIL